MVAFFLDSDDCTRLFLDALDDFSARADDSSDEFLRNNQCLDAWHVRLVVFAWRRDCFVDDSEDVQTAFASLVEGFLKDFVGKSVALDVHLCCSDTVSCSGHLEVHVAEVVLVAENVGKNGIFRTVVVCDKTHCNTRNRLFHLHASVEQRQCAGAYCCHRR